MKPLRSRPAPGTILGLLVLVALAVLLGGCRRRPDTQLEFLAATDAEAGPEGVVSQDRIEELRGDIAEYQEAVNETVRRLGRIATFQKLLAQELMRAEMYEPAMEALQTALSLQTDNAVLYYLAAVTSARSAPAHITDGREQEFLTRAERLYQRALELRGDYKEALYGYAVLLAFELDRPEDALVHASRLAELETRDPAVKFLYANVLVRNGRVDEAIEVYGDLARTAPSADQRRRAQENRDTLQEER